MAAFLTICALVLVGTLSVRSTTNYTVQADRLLIRRAGFTWMEILFRDVEEIENQTLFFDKIFQVRMYRLGFGSTLRIRRKGFFRYVLINPDNPRALIEAYHTFVISP